MVWREREGWLNIVFLGDGRVENYKERDMRGQGKSSRVTGTSENVECKLFCDPRSSRYKSWGCAHWHVYQVSWTELGKSHSWFLVSAHFLHSVPIFFPHLSVSHAQLYHHCRTRCQVIPLYLPMPLSYVTSELQHTLSAEFRVYSIQLRLSVITSFSCLRRNLCMWLQLLPYLPSLVNGHQPVLHKSFKGKVAASQSDIADLTNLWIDSQHPVRLQSTASRLTSSKYSSDLPRLYPASASPTSLDHIIGVHLLAQLTVYDQSGSFTASE
jgi:hypothetical protein